MTLSMGFFPKYDGTYIYNFGTTKVYIVIAVDGLLYNIVINYHRFL